MGPKQKAADKKELAEERANQKAQVISWVVLCYTVLNVELNRSSQFYYFKVYRYVLSSFCVELYAPNVTQSITDFNDALVIYHVIWLSVNNMITSPK